MRRRSGSAVDHDDDLVDEYDSEEFIERRHPGRQIFEDDRKEAPNDHGWEGGEYEVLRAPENYEITSIKKASTTNKQRTIYLIDVKPRASAQKSLRKKNCGTGAGGFQEGNTCASGTGKSEKYETVIAENGSFREGEGFKVKHLLSAEDVQAQLKSPATKEEMLAKTSVDGSKDVKPVELVWWTGMGYRVLRDQKIDDNMLKPLYFPHASIAQELGQLETLDNLTSWDEQKKEKGRQAFREQIVETRKNLRKAVNKSRFNEDVTLYRYLSLDYDKLQPILRRGYIEHKAIQSWTTRINQLEFGEYDNVLLRVKNARAGMVNTENCKATLTCWGYPIQVVMR